MDADVEYSPADIRARALGLLARREHSRLELARKLRQRGMAGADLEQVLDELAAARLLSDTRFAEEYARSRASRGYGPLRIRAELRERGIDDAGIQAALAELGEDWCQQARAARQRRFGAESPADLKERARQSRFLQQRGFSPEQIRQAL
ncbi:MAG: recombination regulator RecX [Gammaproteobacteria bacterium]|nr:recombination regulator RecX [Gammaproteobacteria bacterium]